MLYFKFGHKFKLWVCIIYILKLHDHPRLHTLSLTRTEGVRKIQQGPFGERPYRDSLRVLALEQYNILFSTLKL